MNVVKEKGKKEEGRTKYGKKGKNCIKKKKGKEWNLERRKEGKCGRE